MATAHFISFLKNKFWIPFWESNAIKKFHTKSLLLPSIFHNTVLSQQNPNDILALAGGGFKSMVRIAKSSSRMWCDISKQNRKELLKSLDFFQKEIHFAQTLIQEEKWDELEKWMAKANSLYEIF